MALLPVEHSIRAVVEFAGFSSDTFTLQRNGWKIAVEELWHDESSTIVIKHEAAGVVGYGRCRDFRSRLRHARESTIGYYSFAEAEPPPITYTIERLSQGLIVRGENIVSGFAGMGLIDATPSCIMLDEFDLFNLPAFKSAIAQPTKEDLIVDPADVSAMLEMIRNQQAPIQAEIRERARRREIIPIQHATIFTLPQAA